MRAAAASRPAARSKKTARTAARARAVAARSVVFAVVILVVLLFSKNVYQASLGSYYTFYLMEKFQLSVQTAQFYLFAFFIGIVIGVLLGGLGRRQGRPHPGDVVLDRGRAALRADAAARQLVLDRRAGGRAWPMIIASAFAAILVYAQELLPGRVGLVAGIFYGFSFGLGGLGAAALGKFADLTSIYTVYQATPYLLCLGLLTAFLPRLPGEPKNAH